MTTTQDIRDVVEAELKYDPLIDPSDIRVRNINGDVALNGTVPSYPQSWSQGGALAAPVA